MSSQQEDLDFLDDLDRVEDVIAGYKSGYTLEDEVATKIIALMAPYTGQVTL